MYDSKVSQTTGCYGRREKAARENYLEKAENDGADIDYSNSPEFKDYKNNRENRAIQMADSWYKSVAETWYKYEVPSIEDGIDKGEVHEHLWKKS